MNLVRLLLILLLFSQAIDCRRRSSGRVGRRGGESGIGKGLAKMVQSMREGDL